MTTIPNRSAGRPKTIESEVSVTWRSTAAFVVLLIAFVWPALYNGQPFFFPDTTTYIRGADAGIQVAFKHKSAWSLPPDAQKSVSSIDDKTVLTGRSPYYGALLYLGDLTYGFWLTVIVQACAVLGAIGLALRAARVPRWPHGCIISACIAVATTAPFFTSLLMPDVFAGVAILTVAVLLSARQRLSGRDYLVSLVLLIAACAFHDSHVLILFVLLGAAAIYAVVTRSWTNRIGLAIILLALVIGILAQSVFFAAVRHVVGAAPLRPPFLMARTIEDGPGYRYIRATCPTNGFKICDFADRLPLMADDFLWKSGPDGVFVGASPEDRRELSNEQMRFTLAVIRYDPWGQLSAALKDAAIQLTELGLTEFQYTDLEKDGFAGKIPSAHLKTLRESAAYRGTVPLRLLDAWLQGSVVIAGFIVAAALLRRFQRTPVDSAVVPIIIWTVIGILVNAAVCGILSGPHDRYSSRVAWLLPFAALLILVRPRENTRAAPNVVPARSPSV
jgi:hypothetical protein